MNQKNFAAGLDIGGTKCAAVLGEITENDTIRICGKKKIATADYPDPVQCLKHLCALLAELFTENNVAKENVRGIGISCGSPQDPEKGYILAPPNLPHWVDVHATEIVEQCTGLKAKLENDANACALAEWKFGAGRGSKNMIFLTFGTGLGAGIIADGNLIRGQNGNAGECGHIRLTPDGPAGYGKYGSFEGWCSGGGLAQQGKMLAKKALQNGTPVAWCPDEQSLEQITAKLLADQANAGDKDALAVYEECGRKLGYGISLLIDILNPERIVIGSVFARSENLLRPTMEKVIAEEALSLSADVCRVVPAELGEAIGDIASLAIAAGL
jgi:glucokinase